MGNFPFCTLYPRFFLPIFYIKNLVNLSYKLKELVEFTLGPLWRGDPKKSQIFVKTTTKHFQQNSDCTYVYFPSSKKMDQ
jgi:hypothetical protein